MSESRARSSEFEEDAVVIRTRGISVVFDANQTQPGDDESFQAVDDLSLEVREGERVAIVGTTGCGKSTFLTCLMGIREPTSGQVEVLGYDPVGEFNELRGRVSVVFQTDRLLPWKTTLANARLGLDIMNHMDTTEAEERTRLWLQKLGLGPRTWSLHPNGLSGGMRQRVAIARALVLEPELLLLDEAFGHLDEATADVLRCDFLELVNELGSTVVMVTHSITEAMNVAGRVLVFGRPAKVLADIDIAAGGSREAIREQVSRILQTQLDDSIRGRITGVDGVDSN